MFHISQVQAAASSDSSSVVGPPTINADFIDKVFSTYGSPAAGTEQALYDDGVESGIDPVFALAFFLHEDSFGKTGIGAVNHSLGNIRCSAGYACKSGFRSYATWEEGYRDWYQLILLGYVQGQITIPIVGHACRTVEQIVPVYRLPPMAITSQPISMPCLVLYVPGVLAASMYRGVSER
jgi:hypothetical protein